MNDKELSDVKLNNIMEVVFWTELFKWRMETLIDSDIKINNRVMGKVFEIFGKEAIKSSGQHI